MEKIASFTVDHLRLVPVYMFPVSTRQRQSDHYF